MSRVDPLRITHSRLVRKAVRRLAVLGALLMAGLTITRLAAASGAEDPTVALSQLNAATTPVSFVLSVDVAGATSAKLVVDGQYVGKVDRAPFTFLAGPTSPAVPTTARPPAPRDPAPPPISPPCRFGPAGSTARPYRWR